jgi:hypothetical protein
MNSQKNDMSTRPSLDSLHPRSDHEYATSTLEDPVSGLRPSAADAQGNWNRRSFREDCHEKPHGSHVQGREEWHLGQKIVPGERPRTKSTGDTDIRVLIEQDNLEHQVAMDHVLVAMKDSQEQ